MTRDSFVFYRSFWESVKRLPGEDFKKCVTAIAEYAFDGEEPATDGIERTVFELIKPQIDANNRKYENGSKGGRKPSNNQTISKEEPKKNQTVTKHEPNDNVNVNDNVNDNDNTYNVPLPPVESRPAYPYEDIIDYLNQKAGTHFRHSSADTKKHIKARFNDGFSLEDFKTVIDKKVKEWKGTDMEKFLRPATLFGTKFEGYLNQKEASGSNNKFNSFKQNDYDFSNLEEQLLRR